MGYTTMKYLEDGYDKDTGVWSPTPPLQDNLLPSMKWFLENREWIEKLPMDICFLVPIIVAYTTILLLGRLDIMWHCSIICTILALGKMFIAFTFLTPHAQGKELGIVELHLAYPDQQPLAVVKSWRDAPFWNNLFAMEFRHVADMHISAHTFSTLVPVFGSLWAITEANIPYHNMWKSGLFVFQYLALVVAFALMIVTRTHYSFDIYCSAALVFLLKRYEVLWQWASAITDYFTHDGKFPAPTVENLFQKPHPDGLEASCGSREELMRGRVSA